jgi:tetratricopeptide (TPR) repeat protein
MVGTPKPRASRTRRTKAEIQEEFESIREEVSETNAYVSSKEDEILKQKESQVCESVKDVAMEGILRKFADLGGDISKTLTSLSEKIISEVNLLSNLRQAVSIEARELENLHKIDIAQTALDQLLEEYAQKKEALESEVTAVRQQWDQENSARLCEGKEYEDGLKKARQREIDEYEYKKNLERKKAQDTYEEEVRLREKQNRENQESLEKGWQLREALLKEQEEEIALLRKTVDEFPNRLKKEIDKASSDAVKQTEQRFSQEILLLKRDTESEKKMSELKIKTLEDTIGRFTLQIAALQNQVDEAKKQVQDIAVKAIEGASGAKTLSHINQIAMEQAKTRSAVS